MADTRKDHDADAALAWRRGTVVGLANRGCHMRVDAEGQSVGTRILLRLPADPHLEDPEAGGVSIELPADISGVVENRRESSATLSLLFDPHPSDAARHWASSQLNAASTGPASLAPPPHRARPLPPCPAPGDPLFSLDAETDPVVQLEVEVFWRAEAEPKSLLTRPAAQEQNRRRA